MSQGSPFWQGIILCAALLILFWQTWRGWRAGVMRSALYLAAMTLSVVVGFSAAQVAAAPLGGFKGIGGILTGVGVGLAVGFVVFFALWLLSALLFKRTAQQGSGIVRFFWGLGGAFFGFVFGLLVLWGGISLIRVMGTMAQARMESQAPRGRGVSVQLPPSSPSQPAAARPQPTPRFSDVTRSLVTLKDSLELGPAGKFAESVDPMPADFYDLIFQVTRISTDEKALHRFMEYPGIQKVLDNPRVAELMVDPDLIRAVDSGNFMAVFSNKRIANASQDPELARQLESIDIRAALKFALEKPPASPSPSPFPITY